MVSHVREKKQFDLLVVKTDKQTDGRILQCPSTLPCWNHELRKPIIIETFYTETGDVARKHISITNWKNWNFFLGAVYF